MIGKSKETKKLDVSLRAFQKKAPEIIKEKLVKVCSVNLKKLDNVLEIIRSQLFKNGLVVYQEISDVLIFETGVNIKTILIHKSGEWLSHHGMITLYGELCPDKITDIRKLIIYQKILGLSECLGLSQCELGLNAEEFLK